MERPLIYLDNCCYNRPYDDQSQSKERFDYTQWRRCITERIDTFEALDEFVAASKKDAVFGGSPEVVR